VNRRLSRAPWRQALLTGIQGLHYAILAWGLGGWMIPADAWLIAYMIAMPLLALQWRLNRGVCVLNNLESWLATGRWRDEGDPNQGGFFAGLIECTTGARPTAAAVNQLSYGLLTLFWTFAAIHLYLRP
jgi:hypothetical protein